MTALPLSENDLDRLEEFLDSEIFEDDRLLLDEVQALLCAVVSGPKPLPREQWLPVILGDNPKWESSEQTEEVLDLLTRFHDEIASTLAEEKDFTLLLYPLDEDQEASDFAAWADAYLLGVELGNPDWFEASGDYHDDLLSLLHPVLLLSGVLEAEAKDRGLPWLTSAEVAGAIADAEETLPELPQRIYNFWRIRSQTLDPIRRTDPKVGRNDPCPCGSGKKYKQCCGAQ